MQVETINWEKALEEKIATTRKVSGVDCWNKSAEDYNDLVRTSNYEHGRKVREIFEKEGILKPEYEVVDIAAGPGSISIPFAEYVKKVVAIEPAKNMCKYLIENSQEKGLKNIEIITKKWEEVNEIEHKNKYDIVICSYALWQFPDIGNQLMRMNYVSRGYCCIVVGVKSNETNKEMYLKLGIEPEKIDRFIYLYNILYQRNIFANVRILNTVMRGSVKSAISIWNLFISEYRELNEKDKKIIREQVLKNSQEGMYKKESEMAVIWWKVNRGENK